MARDRNDDLSDGLRGDLAILFLGGCLGLGLLVVHVLYPQKAYDGDFDAYSKHVAELERERAAERKLRGFE